jgi:hypothetical protein
MFWNRTHTVTQGVLGDIRENGGLTAKSLRAHVEDGARLCVPIDPGVSPWLVPKTFELSQKQALELLDALDQSGLRVTYVVRSNGTIALIRRENAEPCDDAVHDRGPTPLPGLPADDS